MTNVFNYWEDYKKKDLPKFNEWLNNIVDKEAISWCRKFAFYLTDKDDPQKDKNGTIIKNEKDKDKDKKRNELSTTKLRKFYGNIKKIESKIKTFQYETFLEKKNKEYNSYSSFDIILNEINLLVPKLAYDVGREKDPHHKIVDFYFAIKEMVENINDKKTFLNFVKLMECIVAYVKAYENEILIPEKNNK